MQQIISEDVLDEPRTVYAGDLDGDGLIDVLAAGFNDDEIIWYKNLGGGLFNTQQIASAPLDGPMSVLTSDIDADGDMDLLACGLINPRVLWYENLGGGQLGAAQIIHRVGGGYNQVKAADIDGDGDLDVHYAGYNDYPRWNENLGNGQFGPSQRVTPAAEYTWGGATSLDFADMDGDGDLDMIYASPEDDQIAWHENLRSDGCMDAGACNYDSEAWIEDGSCCYSNCGCTDPIATNYLPTATCDDGSCIILEGCTNELAINYDPEAVVSNSTCEYSITGTVFFDENANGIMDGNEYVLPNQTVLMNQTGQSHITNEEGNFIAHTFQQQLTSFQMIHSSSFPYSTNANPMIFDPSSSTATQLMFGVSNTMPIYDITIGHYPLSGTFFCDSIWNYIIMYRNMGNWPIDGIIQFEFDSLFQGYEELTPIDSVNVNSVYLSFQNLQPGETRAYYIYLLSPSVDHIGETVTTTAHVYGYFEGELAAYGEGEFNVEITCAYDPNDKQAFPLGYTDQHLLLQETRQEFVIRFQNTGNAPAQNIRVQDTLDVNFDIETFRIIANSHSVMTTIDPETRLVDFYFENIQLPDSVNNEPGSHGLVSYMITPLPDLPVGTVLENTAYIYFDNNDPIITNTTWTTIHECGGESAFEAVTAMICGEQQVNFANSYEYVEHYSWLIDDVQTGVNSELLITSIDQPNYEVTLTASNPLCTETTTLNYVVPPIESIDPCRADFNCDGNRDTQDLLVFMSEFGCLNACEADIDANAIVNVQDLFIFISVFDRSCWE